MPELPRLMFAVGRLHAEASGVTRIMCDLANALCRQGAAVGVYAAEFPGMPSGAHLLKSPSRYVFERGAWLGGLARSPKLSHVIDQAMGEIDVVHNHSLWMLPNHYASASAHRHGRPVVFTAHGVLEPWALARSWWKKKPIAWLWQNRDLHQAACIHTNSLREATGIRAYGLRNPIAIVPNGVDLKPFAQMPAREALSGTHPQLAGKRVLLFLSRLHPKKGVTHLIDAWKPVSADHGDWHLVIAGPDEGSELEARNRVAAYGLQNSVSFIGGVVGGDKLTALAGADAFVLPSFSEGFSMAILEAMAAGLPVLMTRRCNFPEAVSAGAAVEVDPTAVATERGLRQILERTDEQRREMGRRGRELIERRYTWDAVAAQMLELYRWMMGGGAAPAFVEKD